MFQSLGLNKDVFSLYPFKVNLRIKLNISVTQLHYKVKAALFRYYYFLVPPAARKKIIKMLDRDCGVKGKGALTPGPYTNPSQTKYFPMKKKSSEYTHIYCKFHSPTILSPPPDQSGGVSM